MVKTCARPRKRLLPLCLSAALCAAAAPAWAAISENLGVSMDAMSLGNAVTAAPTGIDAIHFNPAGLANIDADTFSQAFLAARLKGWAAFHQPEGYDVGGWKQDPLDGTHGGAFKQALYIPGFGPSKARLPFAAAGSVGVAFHKPGSDWTFATAFYPTQALGFDRTLTPNDPTNFDGKKVILQRLVYLSPSAAYKVSKTLQLGISVPVSDQSFYLSTDMRMPNELLGIIGKLQQGWCGQDGNSNPVDVFAFGLCGGGSDGLISPYKKAASLTIDATAPIDITVNLGVLWEPEPWVSVGAVYQGGSKTIVRGTYEMDAEPMLRAFGSGLYHSLFGPIVGAITGIPPNIPAQQTGYMQAVLPFPAHAQIGIALKPLKGLQITADEGWSDWGSWDKLTIRFDQQIKILEAARIFGVADPSQLVMPRGYKSTWSPGFGVQYQIPFFPALTLRAGYEHRRSSIPGNKVDLIAPLGDMNIHSFGLKYQVDAATTVSASVSRATTHFYAPAGTDCNLNCTNFDNVIYNPYAGLDVSGGLSLIMAGMTLNHQF